MLRGKPVEVAPLENQKLTVIDRDDVSVPALATQQGHLAEERAGLQADGATGGEHLDRTRGNEIHLAGALATTDHPIAWRSRLRVELSWSLKTGQMAWLWL